MAKQKKFPYTEDLEKALSQIKQYQSLLGYLKSVDLSDMSVDDIASRFRDFGNKFDDFLAEFGCQNCDYCQNCNSCNGCYSCLSCQNCNTCQTDCQTCQTQEAGQILDPSIFTIDNEIALKLVKAIELLSKMNLK